MKKFDQSELTKLVLSGLTYLVEYMTHDNLSKDSVCYKNMVEYTKLINRIEDNNLDIRLSSRDE